MKLRDNAFRVADILLSLGVVSLSPEKPFIFTSGIESPIYLDNRILISHPLERRIITDSFCDSILADSTLGSIDVIVGTATAGIPFAAWIADRLEKPMAYVRSEERHHGKGRRIEGITSVGQRAIVIEDLISTGKSAAETVLVLRSEGVIADHCFAIYSYGLLEATQKMSLHNIQLHPLCGFDDVMQKALALGKINNSDYELILAWRNSKDREYSER